MGSGDHEERINCLLRFCFRFASKMGNFPLQIGEKKEKICMLEQTISVCLPPSLPSKSTFSLRIRLPKTFVHLGFFKLKNATFLPKGFVYGFFFFFFNNSLRKKLALTPHFSPCE